MRLSILSAVLLIAGQQFVSAAPAAAAKATPTATSSSSSSNTTSSYIPQFSPSLDVPAATGVVTSYNYGPYNLTTTLDTTTLKGYPPTWESPDVNHPEVKAAIAKIDWTKVPNAPVRKQHPDGSWISTSDGPKDRK